MIKNHLSFFSPRQKNIFRFTGISLGIIFLLLSLLSRLFAYETPLQQKPILVLFFLLFLSGIIFLNLIPFIKKISWTKRDLLFIFAVGLFLRIIFLPSVPMLEDDIYRYLWDGAVTAQGLNPYEYTPLEILQDKKNIDQIPDELRDLAKNSGEVIHRINHPYVRTIYPVLTQAFFAAAFFIKPWSIFSWKLLLIFIDLIIFFQLLWILRRSNKSPALILVYWWNPLLIKEIFNSGHMDILIFPFLLFAIIFSMNRQHTFAVTFLALAGCIKIWPVLFIPLFLKPLFPKWGKMIPLLLLFIFILTLSFWPTKPLEDLQSSAYANYSQRWEMNDSAFKLILWGYQALLPLLGIHPGFGQIVARITIIIIVLLIVTVLTLQKSQNIWRHALIIISTIFLLSPTQFPWYYTWLIPFLVVIPRPSLLFLTPLLSVYYLRYYLESVDLQYWFDVGLVWFQFVPVWLLLIFEWKRSKESNENVNII